VEAMRDSPRPKQDDLRDRRRARRVDCERRAVVDERGRAGDRGTRGEEVGGVVALVGREAAVAPRPWWIAADDDAAVREQDRGRMVPALVLHRGAALPAGARMLRIEDLGRPAV